MFRCKAINFLFIILPLKCWRDFLIRRHIQECPECQKKLAGVEEVKPFLIQEEEVGGLEGLWPEIKTKLSQEKRKKLRPLRPRLRWAFRAVGLFVAIAAGIWLYRIFTLDKSPLKESLVERFQINYIRIEDKPARAFLFQPHDSEMIFVWAEKNI